MKPEVSIIIISWNGKEILRQCLDSIFNQKVAFDYEVIVVDNASQDGTVEMIRNNFKQVRLKTNEKNLGFAAANNLGIKMANAEFIFLLNQDIELEQGVLEGLARFLKKNSGNRIAAVAPMLNYPNGDLQMSLRPFPTPRNVLSDAFSFGKKHAQYYDYQKNQEVDQPMASCLMLDGKILKKVGAFDTDPHFFLYFNDVDLSFRIAALGFKHYYLKDFKVIHHHGQSAKKWPEIARLKAWSKGLYYFLAKHYAKERIAFRFILKMEVFFIFLGRIIIETLKKSLKRQ